MSTPTSTERELTRALHDGELGIVDDIADSWVELDENGAGQQTYRVVLVTAWKVVPGV